MNDRRKTKAQLIDELNALRGQLAGRATAAPGLGDNGETGGDGHDRLPPSACAPASAAVSAPVSASVSAPAGAPAAECGPFPPHLFRQLVEASAEGISVIDRHGCCHYANPHVEQTMGLAIAQMVGRRVDQLLPPEVAADLLQQIVGVCDSGVSRHVAYLLQAHGGPHMWVESSLVPLVEPHGRIDRVMITSRDITARLSSEALLWQQPEILDQIHDAVISTDMAQRITGWNKAAERLYGYTREEALGRPMTMLYPDAQQQQRLQQQIVEPLLRDGQFYGEAEVTTKAGQRLHVHLALSKMHNRDGQPIGMVGCGIDITVLKRVEAELRRAQQDLERRVAERTAELERINAELRESEQRHRLHFDNVNDVICSFDRDLVITSASPSIERVLGFAPEQAIGRKLGAVGTLTPEVAERVIADARQVLTGQRIVRDYPLRHRDGHVVYVELSGSPLVRDGQIIGLILVARDVSERRRAEQELRLSEQRTRALLTAIPDIIFRHSVDGVYLDYIATSAESPAVPASQFIGRSIREVLPAELAERFMQAIGRLRDSGQTQVLEYQLNVPMPAGPPQDYEARLVPVGDSEVMGIVRNITDRKRTEQALRQSEATNRALIEAIPDNLFHVSRDGTYIDFVPTRGHESVVHPSNVVGRNIWDVLPPELAERMAQTIERAFATRQSQSLEYQATLPSGALRHREARLVVTGADRALVLVRDITERKQTEKKLLDYQSQLRSLASDLAITEERERRRIAGELHDRIGQALALAKIKLGMLRQRSAGPGDRVLDEVYALVDQTISDARSLTFEISPPILYELGFESAAEWLAEQIRVQYGLATRFEDDGRPKPLTDDVRVILFRGVRELLVNAAKHARASEVAVSVRRVVDTIRIEVRDNGVGIDLSKVESKRGGFGLFSLRERLGHLGGWLLVESRPGRGSCMTIVAPLGGAAQGEGSSAHVDQDSPR